MPRLNDDFVMIGTITIGHHSGVRQFAICGAIAFEANGKSFNRIAKKLTHQSYDRTGVEAAAEKCSERNVAHEMNTDRFFQQSLKLLGAFCFAALLCVVSRK